MSGATSDAAAIDAAMTKARVLGIEAEATKLAHESPLSLSQAVDYLIAQPRAVEDLRRGLSAAAVIPARPPKRCLPG